MDYPWVYVWHLRKKIEPDPNNPAYFLNQLSSGYRFAPHDLGWLITQRRRFCFCKGIINAKHG
jgi:hypothetical protein